MKDHDLLEAVGGINEKFINNASTIKAKKSKKEYFKWIAAVACLCVVVISIPFINRVFQEKGNHDPAVNEGNDSLVEDMRNLEFNGAYYEATDIPEVLERFGLPSAISESMCGKHIAYLASDGGVGYKEAVEETDIELLEYLPAPCRGVYIIKDGEKYYAALFCNIIQLDENQAAEMDTLYQFYNVHNAEDIANIAEVDWNRNSITGSTITERTEIENFYDLSKMLEGFGNADFQGMVFDGIPEEEQQKLHQAFADDLRMIRIETKEGLRFYIEIYPSYNWIYGNGTMSYYQISEQMAEWINNNL